MIRIEKLYIYHEDYLGKDSSYIVEANPECVWCIEVDYGDGDCINSEFGFKGKIQDVLKDQQVIDLIDYYGEDSISITQLKIKEV